MAQRRLRSALTALAILLGVAMIAGTYVQTDQIRNAFEDIQQTANQGTDVLIQPKREFGNTFQSSRPLPESLVAQVADVPGVSRAAGQLMETGALVRDGERLASNYAPSMVVSTTGAPFDPTSPIEGRQPTGPGEVGVISQMAEREHLTVGQRLGLATRTGVKDVTIVGIFKYGDVSSIGGATVVTATLPQVQQWFDRKGEVSSVVAAAEKGTTPEALAAGIRRVTSADLDVKTGAAAAQQQADEINDSIGGFLTPMLLALAGAALLVGAFIIFNTFSITVAQRTREFALLRALGATRRQIVTAVVGEAFVLGAAASAAGLLAGLGFAKLLGALFDAAGMGIPRAGMELAPRTIAVSLVVGIGVTIAGCAGARPASHSRLPGPGARRHPSTLPPRPPSGAVDRGHRLGSRARDAALRSLQRRRGDRPHGLDGRWRRARLRRPRAHGAPHRAPGRRARRLAPGARVQHPRAPRARERDAQPRPHGNDRVGADGRPRARRLRGRLRRRHEVDRQRLLRPPADERSHHHERELRAASERGRRRDRERAGDPRGDAAVRRPDPGQRRAVQRDSGHPQRPRAGSAHTAVRVRMAARWLGRPARAPTGSAAVVEEQFAKTHRIEIGDDFIVQTPTGARVHLQAIGEYRDPMLLQGLVTDQQTFDRASAMVDPFSYLIKISDRTDPAVVRRGVTDAMRQFPAAKVQSTDEYRADIAARLDQMVYLLYALLAMSVVISLFGIANSLFLSIHERTREFGLLRAIGATRAQVRRIVRYESVITAFIGGLLGIGIGLLFGYLMTAALADLGLAFSVPFGQLAGFLVLAVVVGVLAAVVPARRGARIDVLDALHQE